MKLISRCVLAAGLAVMPLAACGGSSSPSAQGAADTGGSPGSDTSLVPGDDVVVAPDPGDQPVTPDPGPAPTDAEFFAAYAKVQAESSELTLDDFNAKYTPANAPVPFALTYDPTASAYFDAIDSALSLTPAEKSHIEGDGFVVSERLTYPSFGHALLQIYQDDLPVLVTADMILHALHSSYDDILKALEEGYLLGAMSSILEATQGQLAGVDPGDDETAQAALRDADMFLSVARTLLTGEVVPSNAGAAVDAQVEELLTLIEGEQLQNVVLFGSPRKMDFSQFKPRGHYEESEALKRYFKAMIWLGRADLRFLELDPLTGVWTFHTRQLAAAHLLTRAAEDSGALTGWEKADALLRLLVGDIDYITPSGVQKLAKDHSFSAATDVTQMDDATRATLTTELLQGKYGEQKINSHWLETNPMSAEPTPLPPSFAFFGQRFVVDSYVFANVVYDTIVFEGKKVERVLPNPLDALFVLGNDQVVPLLQDELGKYPYQGNLNNLRYLVDAYDDDFWTGNFYNLWLQSLRTLNAPTTSELFPEPMRTPAWRDRVANTQLGSWAQLRHDTILYAKQSYTGGVSCEHPDGYVEPYPELYATLETLADLAQQKLLEADFDAPGLKTHLDSYFGNWRTHMKQLRVLAEKELAGEPFTDDEVAFLKQTVMGEEGCGAPIFSGWYPTLFYLGSDTAGEWDPTIADVHTNPNAGPLPGPDVLHVATGAVNLMVLTSETCDGPEAYVGPVFSYYEIDVKEIKRLADSDWEEILVKGPVPPRPPWTQSFLVPSTP